MQKSMGNEYHIVLQNYEYSMTKPCLKSAKKMRTVWNQSSCPDSIDLTVVTNRVPSHSFGKISSKM